MPRTALDTNILIGHFRRLRPYASRRSEEAERSAEELIASRQTDAIVSPVELEFLCGVIDRHELALAEAFLRSFRVIDAHRIVPDDWEEARRIAKRVPPNAGRRQLGDCLILAIARRFRHDVATADLGLLGQDGRTRRRPGNP